MFILTKHFFMLVILTVVDTFYALPIVTIAILDFYIKTMLNLKECYVKIYV